jgi:NAD(P)-dependent dehydrogenase (short-subunit alcohol dehydrogenase family)
VQIVAKRAEGKVAIVTGGGSGIGAATAEMLAVHGARVTVADINGEAAAGVAQRIVESGGQALAIAADVSVEEEVRGAVEQTVALWGRLDVLHNNAALVDPAMLGRDGKIVDLDIDLWDRTMAVNLRGVMLGCKHAIPAMIASGGGSIINMSSGSSLLGDLERSAYGASKGGVNAFTKYAATQYGRDRVRANAVLPGIILTPAAAVNVPAELLNALRDSLLLPYFGEPDDIAHLVVYLASDESKYVTGQLFAVNGGMSAHQPTYGQRAHSTAATPPTQ